MSKKIVYDSIEEGILVFYSSQNRSLLNFNNFIQTMLEKFAMTQSTIATGFR